MVAVSTERRFDRNERMFGATGQAKIAATRLAIVGCGGLGSAFGQQAAYLGVRSFALVDADVVTESSLNRLVGSLPGDAAAATPKVLVVQRVIRSIEPGSDVDAIEEWLDGPRARSAIVGAHVIIGCLDDDIARLELTAITSEAKRPYLDLASEVGDGAEWYGGRVLFAEPSRRCPYCLGELDPDELALAGLSREQRIARDKSYGVSTSELGTRGASVVSINSVVASLALTELMVYLTGLRPPAIGLTYRGERGVVLRRTDEPTGPCPYCGRD